MPRPKRNAHGWRRRLDDGTRVEVRAHLFGKRWTFQQRGPEDEDWVTIERPSLDDLGQLHEILFNKYQRKHLAWEHLLSVRNLYEAAGGDPEQL